MTPYDLNNEGVVVGGADYPNAPAPSFIWTAATGLKASVIVRNSKRLYIGPSVINDRGDFAGSLVPEGEDFRAVVVNKRGKITSYLAGTWAEYLPSPIKMIESGKVLGESDAGFWLWSSSAGLSPKQFGERHQAFDINNLDQVVGAYGNQFAFVYDVSSKTERYIAPGPGPGGPDNEGWNSRASAINDAGQVVGFYSTRAFGPTLPFIWTAAAGLETLSGVGKNQEFIEPTDINAKGQVVGRYNHTWAPDEYQRTFFYWDAETARVVDVARLIDPADPLVNDVEFAPFDEVLDHTQNYIPKINDRGEILLPGWLRSENRNTPNHTFLLVPVER